MIIFDFANFGFLKLTVRTHTTLQIISSVSVVHCHIALCLCSLLLQSMTWQCWHWTYLRVVCGPVEQCI